MIAPYFDDGQVTLYVGNCRKVLPTLSDASVDAVVCDPPYEIGFMGRGWDATGIAYDTAMWQQCWRILKPGGHLLAFGATRTYHRLAVAIEDAGFEIRDSIHWIYGCLDDQTEIMIDGRWTQWRNASEGNYALGYDAERDEFSWQPIQRVVVFPYSDTAYRLVGDHTDQFVTREHRCLVERGGSYTFQEAQEAARERQARVPVLENVQAVLNALPLPHQGTGSAQPHLLKGMREPNDGCGEYRTAELASKPPALMPGLRKELSPLAGQAARGPRPGVFTTVSGDTGRRPPADSSRRRAQRVDRRITGVGPSQDAWAAEPGVEGRSDLLPEEGQLQGHQVRAVPGGVCADGPEGRLRNGASAGGGTRNGQTADEDGGRASRGSQSGKQRPRKPLAVQIQPRAQAVRGSRFTTADLVRIEPEHYDGTAWCITVPTGAFVARRNGKVFVTGNSGFPKGQDIGKSIDRRRNDRDRVLQVTAFLRQARIDAGISVKAIDDVFGFNGMASHWTAIAGKAAITPTVEQWDRLRILLGFDSPDMDALVADLNDRKGSLGETWSARDVVGTRHSGLDNGGTSIFLSGTTGRDENGMVPITTAASDDAKRWEGWNTALKPAHEPIVVARKSTGFNTVVANVLEHGTGAINVDACRVEVTDQQYAANAAGNRGHADNRTRQAEFHQGAGSAHDLGRWPTNLAFSHSPGCNETCVPNCPVADLDAQTGTLASGANPTRRNFDKFRTAYGDFTGEHDCTPARGADSGGASRFFPVFRYEGKAPASERPRLAPKKTMRLREDLTDEQRAYVLAELTKAGVDAA